MTKTLKMVFLFSMLYLLFYPTILKAASPNYAGFLPGKKLLVGVLHDPPYIVKEATGEWTGLNVDIWKALAQDLKVDYEFREMNFQAQMDSLINKRIDLSIESFYVLAERAKWIDYAFPLGNARLAVATLPEKIQHPWWTAITILFSWGTLKMLAFLCMALFVLGFLFWLIERKNNPDHFGGDKIKGIGSGIYWVGSTLASGVCFGVALKSFPARILGLIWMLLCAIALSALIASLTSAISATRSMVDVVSNEQLQHMHLGGVKQSAETSALKHLGGRSTIYEDEEGALKALINGQIEGLLYDEITLHFYKDNDYKDKISVYPTSFKRFFFAFGLPKDSPLRSDLNYALLTFMEKPEWTFLLKRYGLAENFEEIPMPERKRGK